MTYGKFAYLYDKLMQDVPYEFWVKLVVSSTEKYGLQGKKLLDLACGTGELTIRLAEIGYDVTGADLSVDMLTVAQQKAEEKGYKMFFVEQDMTQLEGLDSFDIIGIFCDSLNYLDSETDVIQTFQSVSKHLKQDGLFIFDVHSIYKMNSLFNNQTYAYSGEDISYIWQCYEGDYENSVEHELTFFELDSKTGRYNRYDEMHYQRTFPIRLYEDWLEEAGFQVLEVKGDFTTQPPVKESERIFIIAKKI